MRGWEGGCMLTNLPWGAGRPEDGTGCTLLGWLRRPAFGYWKSHPPPLGCFEQDALRTLATVQTSPRRRVPVDAA